MSVLDTITRYRKLAGAMLFALAALAGLGMLAQCSVTVGNKSNWTKTTGHIGTSGEARKDSAYVDVIYLDPATKTTQTAHMHVEDESTAQALLDSGGAEEDVYFYTPLVGKPTVCTAGQWDDCYDRAQPRWWMFLIVIGFLVIGLAEVRRRWRNAVGWRVGVGQTVREIDDDDDD
jgi:hypothetical protein